MPRKTARTEITSPEHTAKINKKNMELMKRFLKEKATRSSEKTIVVYESNLIIFFTWNLLHNENKLFPEIKKLEFADFFSYMAGEMQVGSARLNNMRSTLSSFSSFLEKFFDEDYPDFRNVILRVVDSAPKETRREKTILSDEQMEDLLQWLSKKNKQVACWMALAICSGARFSELLRFETSLIDIHRTAFGDIFLETTKQIKTKGRGKNGKQLYKYILRDKFLPYYQDWIKQRERILRARKKQHDFLFLKKNGDPATGATARAWVQMIEGYLKVPFYTHSCRHYLTTLLSRKNIPASLIKEIFGWESTTMVEIYDDSTAKDREYKELENLKI